MTTVDRASSHQYPFVAPGPPMLEVDHTEGCYMVTPDGHRVLDAAGGAIVVSVGQGREEVAEAVKQALLETAYVVPPFTTPARVRLVERLQQRWLPEGLRRIAFGSGGSEAMDTAIRLARRHHVSAGRPERWRVLARDLSYHGTTLATLSLGGHLERRKGFEPLLLDQHADLPKAPAHYCLRCPLGKTYPECGVACADEVETLFERVGPETVAAFVVEPIVGSNAGALVPPGDYLERVAEICRRHGVLLVADEVMTGFGRTGAKFGVDHWGVVPDILVSGKGLTSGYMPFAVICATEEVTAPIAAAGDELMFFTYGGHSACAAAADKVLEILEREKLVERAASMGEILGGKLDRLCEHPHVAEIRGRGLLWAIELVRDRDTLEPFPHDAGFLDKVVAEGIENGVFFYPGGNDPARHVACLGPPLIVSEDELETIVATLEHSIDTVAARLARGG